MCSCWLQGRRPNLGCDTGQPSFVLAYKNEVYVLPMMGKRRNFTLLLKALSSVITMVLCCGSHSGYTLATRVRPLTQALRRHDGHLSSTLRGGRPLIQHPVGLPTAFDDLWFGTSPARPQQCVHDGGDADTPTEGSAMPAKVVDAKTNVGESDGMKVDNIKPQVVRFVIPDVHRVFVLASMPTAEFGARHRHPSFLVSCSSQTRCRSMICSGGGRKQRPARLAASTGLKKVDTLGSRPTERCLPLARELNELFGNASGWPLTGHRSGRIMV